MECVPDAAGHGYDTGLVLEISRQFAISRKPLDDGDNSNWRLVKDLEVVFRHPHAPVHSLAVLYLLQDQRALHVASFFQVSPDQHAVHDIPRLYRLRPIEGAI